MQEIVGWHYFAGAEDAKEEFERRTVELVLDEEEGVVLDALADVLAGMEQGERARVWITSAAVGADGAALGVPANADVMYELTMVTVTNAPALDSLDAAGRLERAKHAKAVGSAAFGKGKLKVARVQYEKSLEALRDTSDYSDEQSIEAETLRAVDYNNLAAVAIKQFKYGEAVEHACSVLEVEPDNVKALFRRGQAERLRLNYKESARDLLKAAKLEPKNAAVRAEYEKTRKAVADAKKKEKATYGSMFSKIEVS